MNIPMEIISVIIGVLIAQLFVIGGFVWKYNNNYRDDKEANSLFLNTLKDSIFKKMQTNHDEITAKLENERHNQQVCRAERTRETDIEFNRLSKEALMSSRDIKELNDKITVIGEKVDNVEDSISTVHRRIDELFAMIKKNNTTRQTASKTTTKSAGK